MQVNAEYQDEHDAKKVIVSDLSILDLAKHAVKTVMHTLTAEDRVALVCFNSKAKTVHSLGEMNKAGRAKADQALMNLEADGQTNLWGGLLAGLEALRARWKSSPGRKRSVLLLTDGKPNISPPHGHIKALQAYVDSHPGFTFQVNTFGFG